VGGGQAFKGGEGCGEKGDSQSLIQRGCPIFLGVIVLGGKVIFCII